MEDLSQPVDYIINAGLPQVMGWLEKRSDPQHLEPNVNKTGGVTR